MSYTFKYNREVQVGMSELDSEREAVMKGGKMWATGIRLVPYSGNKLGLLRINTVTGEEMAHRYWE